MANLRSGLLPSRVLLLRAAGTLLQLPGVSIAFFLRSVRMRRAEVGNVMNRFYSDFDKETLARHFKLIGIA
jgi:hypothetical protein